MVFSPVYALDVMLIAAIHSTVMLSCGLHTCPLKCHQLYDHSEMLCQRIPEIKCPNGHTQSGKCQEIPPPVCLKCERDILAKEKKANATELRDATELAHAKQPVDIQEKSESWRTRRSRASSTPERTSAFQPKQKDLDATNWRTSQAFTKPPIPAGVFGGHSPTLPPGSCRNSHWQPPLSPQARYPLRWEQAQSSPTTSSWRKQPDIQTPNHSQDTGEGFFPLYAKPATSD
jgi:hypothetical protein